MDAERALRDAQDAELGVRRRFEAVRAELDAAEAEVDRLQTAVREARPGSAADEKRFADVHKRRITKSSTQLCVVETLLLQAGREMSNSEILAALHLMGRTDTTPQSVAGSLSHLRRRGRADHVSYALWRASELSSKNAATDAQLYEIAARVTSP
ncbi:MAG: hypothetical protein GY788_01590 [bacterium]|nr:hypothetical protein [bacterium]